ncbi:phage portal protein [Marinobacter sp. M1N3S26]|uniref:phage portal protein n=1 Tax=Marinobacter sp. M1N3S26 TaxID=3382299 RepID=UPI00387B390B
MKLSDLQAQAKALAPVLKDFVSKATSDLRDEFKQLLDDRDRELGKRIDRIVVPALDDIAREVSELIEKPADGKDADPEVIRQMVTEVIAEIPAPEDGKDGESVSVEDVQRMVDEAVAKAMESVEIPAPQDGKDGESVPVEDVQRMVDEAVAKAMESVEVPKDGEPGRDAVDIDILPDIDPEKSYPRGTYATHAGGLWRSHSTTQGMRGWECIVDGVKDIEVTPVDDRTFKVNVQRSSGDSAGELFSMPIVIDRGVYRPDEDYEKGDGVSFGGSFWIAQKGTPDGKPGTTDDWRLAVKHGRPGKQGEQGPKGKDGRDGRAGRDLTKMLPDGGKY